MFVRDARAADVGNEIFFGLAGKGLDVVQAEGSADIMGEKAHIMFTVNNEGEGEVADERDFVIEDFVVLQPIESFDDRQDLCRLRDVVAVDHACGFVDASDVLADDFIQGSGLLLVNLPQVYHGWGEFGVIGKSDMYVAASGFFGGVDVDFGIWMSLEDGFSQMVGEGSRVKRATAGEEFLQDVYGWTPGWFNKRV